MNPPADAAPPEPFPSIAAMRAAHAELLQLRRDSGLAAATASAPPAGPAAEPLIAAASAFIHRARAAGVHLDDEDHRNAAQSLLTYWANALQRLGHEVDDAVLAEYAHVLREALGHLDRDPGTVAAPIAKAMYEALSIRAANYTADDIRTDGGDLVVEPWKLRARFALRFGAQSAEDQAELQRAGTVRTAFNSPFWPFVLATTLMFGSSLAT